MARIRIFGNLTKNFTKNLTKIWNPKTNFSLICVIYNKAPSSRGTLELYMNAAGWRRSRSAYSIGIQKKKNGNTKMLNLS